MLESVLAKIYLVPFGWIFWIVVLGLTFRSIRFSIVEDRTIGALGERAPQYSFQLPWSLDFFYRCLTYSKKGQMLKLWRDMLGRNRTVEIYAGGQRTLVTVDPENVKAILATQFADYGKGPAFNAQWHDFLGDGIFAVDGQIWHDSRQLIRPQFIKDRVSDLDTFQSHISILLPLLDGQKVVPFDELMFRYTLDAATQFLFGRSVHSLSKGNIEFALAFNEIQRIQILISRWGPLGWLVPRKAFHKHLKVLNDFIEPFVEEALSLSTEELESKSKSDVGYTFLHALAGYTRDKVVLRDQLVSTLLAGRDTTAATLSWLFYEISKQPQIVAKLRDEIRSHIGLERAPTYSELKNMKYLQHTINETLRLYPAVPYNVRKALQDTTLPRGGGPDGDKPIGVPKGCSVAYSPLLMQRTAELEPESKKENAHAVENFVPERWETWHPKPFHYIPFNAGPRICIGQQFALSEMGYTIVRILQTYTKIDNRMSGPAILKEDVILIPANPIELIFYK